MSQKDFSPEPGSHWGLLGGAFDPPHLGHLALATAALSATSPAIGGVALLVTATPPHKRIPTTNFSDRLAMAKTLGQDNSKITICDIESELPAPSYTVHVVEELTRRHPKVNFSIVIGSDNLQIIEQWFEIERLMGLSKLIIAERPGVSGEAILPQKWADRAQFVEIAPHEISSSELRRKISLGESIAGLTSDPVIDYIRAHNLYSE